MTKKWFFKNKFQFPQIKNLFYLLLKVRYGLHSPLFLQKLHSLGSCLSIFYGDDMLVFEYKNRLVELINFKIRPDSKNSKFYHYLCLTTTNPDPVEGQTVA